jgi:[acyl-carrier-protein] S-malonyltransferase
MALAVVFPGQGSQKVGMGKELDSELFEQADAILGYKLSDITFNGPSETLELTQNTQPALLTHSYALWNLLKTKRTDITPKYFAGHSLGEYTAILAAGGFEFKDALKAVHNRGKFMQNAVPVGVGGMAAIIGADKHCVERACKVLSTPGSIVEPANFNSDSQIVVAGSLDAIDRLIEKAMEFDIKKVIKLQVSAPFHSSMMKQAEINMKEYLKDVMINELKTPILNNSDNEFETSPEEVRSSLARQITSPVNWVAMVKKLIAFGATRFIEVGSGSVLTGLIKKIDKTVECTNLSTLEDISKL